MFGSTILYGTFVNTSMSGFTDVKIYRVGRDKATEKKPEI
jgi:hypothetical protein